MAFGREKPALGGLRIYSPEHVQGDRNKLRSLTAAGERLNRLEGERTRRVTQNWQQRAFLYYDTLGEIKYAAQFYSRALSKLRLFAAEVDESGEVIESENPQAVEQLERIQDPGGGRSGLLSAYGRLMFLTGESILFVTVDHDTEEEQWEFLSTDEIKIDDGDPPRYRRIRAPTVEQENYTDASDDDYAPVGDEAIGYRIWRRHPRYSYLADATMLGVLDICEELVLLTQTIKARARSRLAGSGILLVPDSVGPAPPVANANDEDPMQDPFLVELTEAMTAPIADEGSASAVVPMVIRGQVEGLDAVRHLQVVDPMQLYPETGLRMELIQRLGIGLDLPPEILMGMADSNHWTAWQVDEQTWKAHLQPVAQYLVDDLSSAFFRPTLKQQGLADWQRFTIAYDPADVINHPDQTTNAKDAHDRLVISDAAYREAAGFTDEDAPDEAELEARKPAPPAELDPAAVDGDSNGAGPTGSSVVEKKAPEDRQLNAAAVMGALAFVLRRGREKAGARLLGLAKKDKGLEKTLRAVRTTQVAYAIGTETAKALNAPEARELVAGCGDLLGEVLDLEDEAARFLSEQIERHAARTLYEERPAPLPPSLANYVLELQTT